MLLVTPKLKNIQGYLFNTKVQRGERETSSIKQLNMTRSFMGVSWFLTLGIIGVCQVFEKQIFVNLAIADVRGPVHVNGERQLQVLHTLQVRSTVLIASDINDIVPLQVTCR